MIKTLINLGLIITPYAVWSGMDLRTPKEIVGFGVALALGLFALYSGKLKKFNNYWLLILVGYFLISMCMSPHFDFMLAFKEGNNVTLLGKRNISGFWAFKTFSFAIVYLLMLITVASQEFTSKDLKNMLNVMAYAGVGMALYIFIQAAGLDQFFSLGKAQEVQHTTQALLGGFIGHPTICAPFIAMIIPIAIYLKKYIFSLCMIVAVCLTRSDVAIGGMIVGCLGYLLISSRIANKRIGITLLLMIVFGSALFLSKNLDFKPIKFIEARSSGRFEAWGNMYKDFVTPVNGYKRAVTGFGAGAFEYTHSVRKKNNWQQAHNEPLEMLYNFGIVGFGLLLLSMWTIIKNIYEKSKIIYINESLYCLLGSLVVIFICSLGSFPFHIAPTMFYTTIIIGLIHNENILGGTL